MVAGIGINGIMVEDVRESGVNGVGFAYFAVGEAGTAGRRRRRRKRGREGSRGVERDAGVPRNMVDDLKRR